MNAPVRLIGFFALLALVVAASFAIGRVAPVDPAEAASEEHGGMKAAESALPGLAVAAGGFRLAIDDATLPPGRQTLSFRVLDEGGRAVRDYDILHERPLHLILVRRDLSGFQHLHPELGNDRRWRVDVELPVGVFRVFADFESNGTRAVLGADVFVGEGSPAEPLPAPSTVARSGGYEVELAAGEHRAGEETPLRFAVRRGGRELTPEPYLGARGHLVVLREGDLAYIHAHADEGAPRAEFETTLPSAGRYRAFLQFAHNGSVQTVEYTLEAS